MKKRLPELKEHVINNWFYKLVAFFVAIAIWVTTLQGRKDGILWLDMNLEFMLGSSFSIVNSPDKTVRVKVSGPRVALKKFTQSSQVISVNLLNELAGEKKVKIIPEYINLPTGIKLLIIEPSELDLIIKEGSKL
ncbi:MAG: hypothetical protein A2Z20_05550 [Bdellovibrionales bacterium RBG_16_40_8]|nr:MAG: hypothetical protein A2Z20_05550 [Bdellovibrionales bacterium RBG_16_40_8]